MPLPCSTHPAIAIEAHRLNHCDCQKDYCTPSNPGRVIAVIYSRTTIRGEVLGVAAGDHRHPVLRFRRDSGSVVPIRCSIPNPKVLGACLDGSLSRRCETRSLSNCGTNCPVCGLAGGRCSVFAEPADEGGGGGKTSPPRPDGGIASPHGVKAHRLLHNFDVLAGDSSQPCSALIACLLCMRER